MPWFRFISKICLVGWLSLSFSLAGLSGLALCVGEYGHVDVEPTDHTLSPTHCSSHDCVDTHECMDVELFPGSYDLISFHSQKLLTEPVSLTIFSYQDLPTPLPIIRVATQRSFEAPRTPLHYFRSTVSLRI